MLENSDPVSLRDEDGASAVEYGLLISGIAAIVVAVIFLFGGMVAGVFDDTCISVDTGSNQLNDLRKPVALPHRLLRYHERRDAERLLSGRA